MANPVTAELAENSFAVASEFWNAESAERTGTYLPLRTLRNPSRSQRL